MLFFHDGLMEHGPLPDLPVVIVYALDYQQNCALIEPETANPLLVQSRKSRVERALYADPFELRDQFQAVRTPAQARLFLENCGPWLPSLPEYSEKIDVQKLTWSQFQRWQQHFSDRQLGLNGSPSNSLPGMNILLISEFRGSQQIDNLKGEIKPYGLQLHPHLTVWVTCSSAAETISAAIELDRMRHVEYRVCQWKKCQQLFRVGAHEEKKCCNDKHLHNAGQSRRRAAKLLAEKQRAA